MAHNAAVAFGNVHTGDDVPTLEAALRDDEGLVPGSTRFGRVRPQKCEPELTARPETAA